MKNNSKLSIKEIILIIRNESVNLNPNSRIIKEYKDYLPNILNPYLKEIYICLILGDASLRINKNKDAGLIRFEWGDVNKEYAFYVYNTLGDYCLNPPRKQERLNKNGNLVVTWCFQTVTHPAFLFLYDLFILKDIKTIKKEALEKELTAVSLAFWYIDDGYSIKNRYSLELHTQSFTSTEVENLCEILRNNFKLVCWLKYSKKIPIILISGQSFQAFFHLVKPHIHLSIRRKFPKLSDVNWDE